MDDVIQTLKAQNYKPEEIEMIMAVMNDPIAYQYAIANQNFHEAYKMTAAYKQKQQQNEKPKFDIDLNAWFSSFATESPEDAKSLSISLNKFARHVQSMTDKNKAP